MLEKLHDPEVNELLQGRRYQSSTALLGAPILQILMKFQLRKRLLGASHTGPAHVGGKSDGMHEHRKKVLSVNKDN